MRREPRQGTRLSNQRRKASPDQRRCIFIAHDDSDAPSFTSPYPRLSNCYQRTVSLHPYSFSFSFRHDFKGHVSFPMRCTPDTVVRAFGCNSPSRRPFGGAAGIEIRQAMSNPPLPNPAVSAHLRVAKRSLYVLRHRPRSANRTRSPAAVSQKREYFEHSPETIGDFSLEVAKFGVWRPTANLQKPAIGGHFWQC